MVIKEEKHKKEVVRMWSEGRVVGEILDRLHSLGETDATAEDVFAELRKFGGGDSGREEDYENLREPDSLLWWIYDWQLERLKKYKNLEKEMGIPIPDVRGNIALMLNLIRIISNRKDRKDMDVMRDVFGIE